MKAEIKITIINNLGATLFKNKLISATKIIKKGIKRGNRLNPKKGINYKGEFIETMQDNGFPEYFIILEGDSEEVTKDLDKINNFLQDKIGYIKKTNIKMWEKIRKKGKDMIFLAYSMTGVHISNKILKDEDG